MSRTFSNDGPTSRAWFPNKEVSDVRRLMVDRNSMENSVSLVRMQNMFKTELGGGLQFKHATAAGAGASGGGGCGQLVVVMVVLMLLLLLLTVIMMNTGCCKTMRQQQQQQQQH